ncbi:uncharacterized protein LOC144162438 isoform X1 [Haemaphysalis longicornis]
MTTTRITHSRLLASLSHQMRVLLGLSDCSTNGCIATTSTSSVGKHKTFQWKPKPWLLPSAWVFITGFGWMAVAVVVSIVTCIYRHVKRKCILGRMTVQERLMPPPLAPARSCAPRYSNRGQQPLISGAMAPPVVPYPAQQCGNPPQSVPCTQVTLYNAWNGESLPPPSAPPPTAPLDTPASFSYDPVYKQ